MTDPLSHDLASLKIDRSANTARGRSPFGALFLVALLVGGGALAWRYGLPRLDAMALNTPEVETAEIAMVSPSSQQGEVNLTATGFVVPQLTVKVSARVTARIERVNVQEGARVHVGQELFVLEAASKGSSVVTAEARAGAARARSLTARANLAEAEQQLERQRKLAASGAVSQSTVDDLVARTNILRAQVTSADADTNALVAEKRGYQVEMKDLVIRSTIEGRAITRPAAVGDLAAPDKALVELADFSSLLVEVDVAENRLEQIKPETPAEIVLDAYPSKRLRGAAVTVNPKINRAKATGTVKVRFIDGADIAMPDMAARVSFLKAPLASSEAAEAPKKVVPASAVIDRGGEKIVFVVEAGGRLRATPLKLGATTGGQIEVLEGPAQGTRIVRAPTGEMADGKSVKVKP